jgi:hypothetical protein
MRDGRTRTQDSTTGSGERRALREVRAPGPLSVSPEVADALSALVGLQRGAGAEVDLSPVLSLEAVDALEDHLRARLPDDVLAIFAARPRALESFELGRVGARCEVAWQGGLRKSRVALGPHGKHVVCVMRRPEAGHPLRVLLFDPEDASEADAGTLPQWLRRVLDAAVEAALSEDAELPEGEDAWDVLAGASDVAPLTPRLERTLTLPEPGAEAAGRRVRHRRFGEGVVLRQLPGTEKLEIDFGEAGVKVLVAEYVEEVGAGG